MCSQIHLKVPSEMLTFCSVTDTCIYSIYDFDFALLRATDTPLCSGCLHGVKAEQRPVAVGVHTRDLQLLVTVVHVN